MTTQEKISIDAVAFTVTSKKPFDDLCADLQKVSAENQFRTLAVHNVQETLAEKGFEREPLTIIEVCNAGFAHQALQKDLNASLFMPCKIVVAQVGDQVTMTLGRPAMIDYLLPEAGLTDLAADVETRLKKIMAEVA